VLGLDLLGTDQVCDRSSDPQDAEVPPRAQTQALRRGAKEDPPSTIGCTAGLDLAWTEIGVAANPRAGMRPALGHPRPRTLDSIAHDDARLAPSGCGEVTPFDRRHLDVQVDAIQKRAADAT
jgi:hypothetical protein